MGTAVRPPAELVPYRQLAGRETPLEGHHPQPAVR